MDTGHLCPKTGSQPTLGRADGTGKSTAQIGLVLRALNELGLPMQIDLSPKDETKPAGFIDLDSIIRETATPYTVKR